MPSRRKPAKAGAYLAGPRFRAARLAGTWVRLAVRASPAAAPGLNSGDENMAQDDRYDRARLERIERRLQTLEDAEAIRNLKARYAALCDSQYDADGIAMLVTEDALWERPGLGR